MDFTKFDGIIFDLDGTLIKSSHVWSDIDKKFLGKRGIEVPHNYFKEISAMNFRQGAEYTIKRFGLDENADDIMKEWFDMALYEYAHNVYIKAGADDFLSLLKSNGLKIALATAASEPLYTAVLKNNGIYDYFDFFADTSQVKRGKGFPDVYEFACCGLGLTPQKCAVFEDIIEGIRGANAGGFFSVACLDNSYCADWGDMIKEADFHFTDYSEVLTPDGRTPPPTPTLCER